MGHPQLRNRHQTLKYARAYRWNPKLHICFGYNNWLSSWAIPNKRAAHESLLLSLFVYVPVDVVRPKILFMSVFSVRNANKKGGEMRLWTLLITSAYSNAWWCMRYTDYTKHNYLVWVEYSMSMLTTPGCTSDYKLVRPVDVHLIFVWNNCLSYFGQQLYV